MCTSSNSFADGAEHCYGAVTAWVRVVFAGLRLHRRLSLQELRWEQRLTTALIEERCKPDSRFVTPDPVSSACTGPRSLQHVGGHSVRATHLCNRSRLSESMTSLVVTGGSSPGCCSTKPSRCCS